MSAGASGERTGGEWPGQPATTPSLFTHSNFCARGWTLLSLLTGFFLPSPKLLPYVTKFLQESGLSQGGVCVCVCKGTCVYVCVACKGEGTGRAWAGSHRTQVTLAWPLSTGPAQSSQENLQRTVKYGGRQRLPSPGELKAFLVWRCRWPGGLGQRELGGLCR